MVVFIDEQMVNSIKEVFEESGYLLDPHGAVGYLSLKKYLEVHTNDKGIFLETAHPVKFPEAVESVTGEKINIPESISSIMSLEKKSIRIKADYNQFHQKLKSVIKPKRLIPQKIVL